MGIFNAGIERNQGNGEKEEDRVAKAIQDELNAFLAELKNYSGSFLDKAIDAFSNNDRYTCAIFYTLWAISLNSKLEDIVIKEYLSRNVFAPSNCVTIDLSLDENQKKDVVDSAFDRSIYVFGGILSSLDLSLSEDEHLPFNTRNRDISFFDFIGICKKQDIWPDIRQI